MKRGDAKVTLNGRRLSDAEVKVIKTALGFFKMEMFGGDPLGSDEHSRAMAAGYLRISTELESELVEAGSTLLEERRASCRNKL